MNKKKMFKTIEYVLLFFICLFSCVLIFGPKYIKLYGIKYNLRSEVIDLSDAAVTDLNILEDNLAKFPNVDSVLFGQRTITSEEKEHFNNIYPNIAFQATVTYNLYGTYFPENAKKLNLNTVPVDDNLVYYLERFYNLEEVELYGQSLSIDTMIKLRQTYPEVEFLWNITLPSGTKIDSDSVEVDFSGEPFNNFEELVNALILLKNVKKVEMGTSQFSHDELGYLRELFPDKEINWVIHLDVWTLRTDDVAFSVLITNFHYTKLRTADIEVLKYCTKLQALDLGHQSLTDLSVIGDYLTDLRVLILADNKITDITPLSKLKHLHYLELFLNDITDLSPLSELNEMVDLNICYNPHLSNVYPIMNYGLLERLWLVNIPISNEDYEILSNNYPEVVISRYGYGSTGGSWRTHQRYFDMIDMYHNNYISESFTRYDNK